MIQTPVLETMFLCILFQFLYKVRPETVFFPPNTSFINSIITNGFNGKPCVRDLFAHSLLFIRNNQLPIIIYVTQHRAASAISNSSSDRIAVLKKTVTWTDAKRLQRTSCGCVWCRCFTVCQLQDCWVHVPMSTVEESDCLSLFCFRSSAATRETSASPAPQTAASDPCRTKWTHKTFIRTYFVEKYFFMEQGEKKTP